MMSRRPEELTAKATEQAEKCDGRATAGDMTAAAPLYVRVMGESWIQLAEPVRRLHAPRSRVRAHGRFRVEHGSRRLAGLAARLLRLPSPGVAAATRLVVTARDGGERWERTLNGRRLETSQYAANDGNLAERFGMLELQFRLEASHGSLLYVQRAASLVVRKMRIRIPTRLAPRVEAREDPAGPNSLEVDVSVELPFGGRLIAYHGIVEIEDAPA